MDITKRRLFYLIMVAAGYTSFSPHAQAEEPDVYPDTFNDWVYRSAQNAICGGYYIPPKFPPNAPDVKTAPTEISANYNSLALKGISTLTGNVEVERGAFRLRADQMSFYRDPQTENVLYANATGHVLVEEPSARLYGSEASIDLLTERLEVQNAQFRAYSSHARGSASSISQQRNFPMYLNEATYTTCAPDDNAWEIRAKTVSLDQESNRGVAKNAWLYIKDVPVFYTPFVSFPLTKERKSGFLSPTYVNSTNAGLQFSQPYYFNLAPDYDDTLTATWYSKRGFQAQNEYRYLWGQNQGVLYAEWLPYDHTFADFREDNLSYTSNYNDPRVAALESASADRQVVYFNQQGKLSSQWLLDIDYHYVSDDNYFPDLNPPYFDLNNRTLEREVETSYYGKYWSLYGRALDYQNLQPYDASIQQESYNVLPQFFLTGEYPNDLLGTHFALSTQASAFDHNNELFTHQPVTVGNRYGVIPEASYQWRRPYAYFNPRAQLYYISYDLNLGTEDEILDNPSNPSQTLPLIDIDTGLFFDRSFNLFGNSYSQSLEPRLFYLYVPYRDQNDLPNFDSELMEFNYRQMFRTNRFSGYDRIGDANQLTLAASSLFTNTSTGQDRARLSVGQILYFEDRKVSACDEEILPNCIDLEDPTHTQDYSPLAGELYYYINQNWSGLVEILWDPELVTSLEQRRFELNYQDDSGRLLSLGYSFIYQGNPDPDQPTDSSLNNLEQIDAAFGWQILPQWNVLAGIEYDVTNAYYVNNFAGVEYENCCWAIRGGAQRYLTINSSETTQQFDEQYFIQFSLKGLVAVGPSPGGLFSQELQGYRDTFGTRY